MAVVWFMADLFVVAHQLFPYLRVERKALTGTILSVKDAASRYLLLQPFCDCHKLWQVSTLVADIVVWEVRVQKSREPGSPTM